MQRSLRSPVLGASSSEAPAGWGPSAAICLISGPAAPTPQGTPPRTPYKARGASAAAPLPGGPAFTEDSGLSLCELSWAPRPLPAPGAAGSQASLQPRAGPAGLGTRPGSGSLASPLPPARCRTVAAPWPLQDSCWTTLRDQIGQGPGPLGHHAFRFRRALR